MSEIFDIGRTWTPEGDIFGIDWAAGQSGEQKRREATKAAEAGPDSATVAAEEAKREEEARRTARARLLAESTSGFGGPTNTARSFLTTF